MKMTAMLSLLKHSFGSIRGVLLLVFFIYYTFVAYNEDAKSEPLDKVETCKNSIYPRSREK